MRRLFGAKPSQSQPQQQPPPQTTSAPPIATPLYQQYRRAHNIPPERSGSPSSLSSHNHPGGGGGAPASYQSSHLHHPQPKHPQPHSALTNSHSPQLQPRDISTSAPSISEDSPLAHPPPLPIVGSGGRPGSRSQSPSSRGTTGGGSSVLPGGGGTTLYQSRSQDSTGTSGSLPRSGGIHVPDKGSGSGNVSADDPSSRQNSGSSSNKSVLPVSANPPSVSLVNNNNNISSSPPSAHATQPRQHKSSLSGRIGTLGGLPPPLDTRDWTDRKLNNGGGRAQPPTPGSVHSNSGGGSGYFGGISSSPAVSVSGHGHGGHPTSVGGQQGKMAQGGVVGIVGVNGLGTGDGIRGNLDYQNYLAQQHQSVTGVGHDGLPLSSAAGAAGTRAFRGSSISITSRDYLPHEFRRSAQGNVSAGTGGRSSRPGTAPSTPTAGNISTPSASGFPPNLFSQNGDSQMSPGTGQDVVILDRPSQQRIRNQHAALAHQEQQQQQPHPHPQYPTPPSASSQQQQHASGYIPNPKLKQPLFQQDHSSLQPIPSRPPTTESLQSSSFSALASRSHSNNTFVPPDSQFQFSPPTHNTNPAIHHGAIPYPPGSGSLAAARGTIANPHPSNYGTASNTSVTESPTQTNPLRPPRLRQHSSDSGPRMFPGREGSAPAATGNVGGGGPYGTTGPPPQQQSMKDIGGTISDSEGGMMIPDDGHDRRWPPRAGPQNGALGPSSGGSGPGSSGPAKLVKREKRGLFGWGAKDKDKEREKEEKRDRDRSKRKEKGDGYGTDSGGYGTHSEKRGGGGNRDARDPTDFGTQSYAYGTHPEPRLGRRRSKGRKDDDAKGRSVAGHHQAKAPAVAGQGSPVEEMIGWLCATGRDDWSRLLALCDQVSSSDQSAREAARAVRKEIKYGTVDAQVRGARLMAIMFWNSNERFRLQIASKRFLEVVEDVYKASKTNPHVKDMLYKALSPLAYDCQNDLDLSTITAAFNRVKPATAPINGHPLDEFDTTFTPAPAGGRRLSHPPPQSQVPSQPEPIPPIPTQAQAQPPSVTGGPAVDMFAQAEVARNNAKVLQETLQYTAPEDVRGSELCKEFWNKCQQSQDFLANNIPWAMAQAEQARDWRQRQRQQDGLPDQLDDSERRKSDSSEGLLLEVLLLANSELADAFRMYDDTLVRADNEAEMKAVQELSKVETRFDRSNAVFGEDGQLYHQSSHSHLMVHNTGPVPSSSRSPSPRPPELSQLPSALGSNIIVHGQPRREDYEEQVSGALANVQIHPPSSDSRRPTGDSSPMTSPPLPDSLPTKGSPGQLMYSRSMSPTFQALTAAGNNPAVVGSGGGVSNGTPSEAHARNGSRSSLYNHPLSHGPRPLSVVNSLGQQVSPSPQDTAGLAGQGHQQSDDYQRWLWQQQTQGHEGSQPLQRHSPTQNPQQLQEAFDTQGLPQPPMLGHQKRTSSSYRALPSIPMPGQGPAGFYPPGQEPFVSGSPVSRGLDPLQISSWPINAGGQASASSNIGGQEDMNASSTPSSPSSPYGILRQRLGKESDRASRASTEGTEDIVTPLEPSAKALGKLRRFSEMREDLDPLEEQQRLEKELREKYARYAEEDRIRKAKGPTPPAGTSPSEPSSPPDDWTPQTSGALPRPASRTGSPEGG